MGGKAALILVLGFGFIFGYIAVRINVLESRSIDNASTYLEASTSHYMAVAGANIGLTKLYQDTLLWFKPSTFDSVLTSGSYAGVDYNVRYKQLGEIGGHKFSRIQSISRFASYGRTFRDTVEIHLRLLTTYEIMGMLMGHSGNSEDFVTYDTTWGRGHHNGKLWVRGSPVFHDKMTLSKSFAQPPGTGHNQGIYLNGWEEGVEEIPIASSADADSQTFPRRDTTFTGNWSFDFIDTALGFVVARPVLHTYAGGVPTIYVYNSPIPPKNGVLGVNGDVSIRGKIKGKLTLAVTGRVFLDDDVRYSTNPLVDPGSTDMLGIVARSDIVIWSDMANPKTSTADKEWIIDAVMISLNGKFDWVSQNNWWGVFRVLGGVISPVKLDIGQFANNPPPPDPHPYLARGFNKRLRWDSRLADPVNHPPHFPTPGFIPMRLHIVNWWENVRLPEY